MDEIPGKKKRDWIKIISIILAVVFFIFWIIAANANTNSAQDTQNLAVICNASIQSTLQICNASVQNTVFICQSQLTSQQNQWEMAFDTLLNCYKNGIPKCEYRTPTLNFTK